MSKNDMVMVSRELAEAILGNASQGYFSKDHGDALRAALKAQQHQGVPVAWRTKFTGEWTYAEKPHPFDEPGLHLSESALLDHWEPVYAHADPGEVERLRAQLDERDHQLGLIGTCLGEILVSAKHIRAGAGLTGPQLLQFGEELRDCLSASAEPSATDSEAISESSPKWQPCTENYRNTEYPQQRIQDMTENLSYKESEPSAPVWDGKSWDVIYQREGKTVLSIRTDGVMDAYDRDGLMALMVELASRPLIQEPSAPVERNDATLIDALLTCEKWFVKHSPTAQLIGGFGDAEHPMLTCIRAALARKP